MYTPSFFEETDLPTIHDLIRARPLGLLVSASQDELLADPVPFVLETGLQGTFLKAHVARANPQWKHIRDGARVLVVFQGAQAYVTPSWYASKKEHGKVVPTWNYAIVQARGLASIHEDAGWLRGQITCLTDEQEHARADRWAVTDAPERYIDVQLRGIVGIEIKVTELAGKWKTSQNREDADKAGVAEGLSAEGHAEMSGMVSRSKM